MIKKSENVFRFDEICLRINPKEGGHRCIIFFSTSNADPWPLQRVRGFSVRPDSDVTHPGVLSSSFLDKINHVLGAQRPTDS